MDKQTYDGQGATMSELARFCNLEIGDCIQGDSPLQVETFRMSLLAATSRGLLIAFIVQWILVLTRSLLTNFRL